MKIVILGGGFGGVYTLKYLHKFFHNKKKVKLILVNKKNYFIFTPLLHEVATGGIPIDNALEPIREIIKCCDFDFIHGEVEKIDLENKIVYIKKSQPYADNNLLQNKKRENYNIDYDYLVIALGSKTNYYNIPGAQEYSYSLKSIDDAIRLKNHFVHMFELASLYPEKSQKYLTFVIVGGGATGIELAGEMSDLFYKTFSKLYSSALISQAKIILIEKGKELLPQFSPKLRQKAFERLKKLKIDVKLEKGVVEVGKDFIKLNDGNILETRTVIWSAGVGPNLPEIVGKVEKDNKERLVLNEYLQVKKKMNAERTELKQNSQNLTQNLQKNTEAEHTELTQNLQKSFDSSWSVLRSSASTEEFSQFSVSLVSSAIKDSLDSSVSALSSSESKNNSVSSASVKHGSVYENVFAIGDVCCFVQDEKPLPQLAQVAVRQAKTVALNVKNSIENKNLEKFIYNHTGDLISIGRFYALGEIKGVQFSGLISWFIWKGVYLSKIISFRDKVKTFIDWILSLFLPRDITEL